MEEVVSTFFTSANSNCLHETSDSKEIYEELLQINNELYESLKLFKLPVAVKCIYNPTIYAKHTFEMYIKKYCNTKKKIMFFGMNPGPWGMSQTGVPFGEVTSVRDFLGISGPVGKPPKELRERPIKGFQCTRTEISGKRFWGLIQSICVTPEKFFETSFVYNYINQQWMKGNGCNLTPGDFKVSEMEPLYNICDPVFIEVLKLYSVEIIVAIGKFCETRALKALKKYLPHHSIQVVYLPHPSPRTVNNNDWSKKAVEHLKNLNLLQYYT